MREPIPLTDEMIDELIKLRRKGMGLRPLGEHFGVSHQTIKNWLKSLPIATLFSESIGFASGDRVTFKRNIKSGMYRLRAGEEVRIDEIDPAASKAWGSGFHTFDHSVDVPLDALEPAKKSGDQERDHGILTIVAPAPRLDISRVCVCRTTNRRD